MTGKGNGGGWWRWLGWLGPAVLLAAIVWAAVATAHQGCMLTCDYPPLPTPIMRGE